MTGQVSSKPRDARGQPRAGLLLRSGLDRKETAGREELSKLWPGATGASDSTGWDQQVGCAPYGRGHSGQHLGAGVASSQVKRLGLPSTPEHLPVGLGSQRHSRVQPFSRGQICPNPALCSQFQARAFLPDLSTSIQKRRRRAPLSCSHSSFPQGPESLS